MISCHRSCIFVYSEVKMVIHTVRKGDSIYSIAREYGVPPSRIITDNMLENPSKLAVGQSLVILFPTQTHTVRGGDTLQSIARMYGLTLNELYRNNPILGGVPTIYPGQVLNISYPEPSLGEFSTNGVRLRQYRQSNAAQNTAVPDISFRIFNRNPTRRKPHTARRRRRAYITCL